MVQAVTEATSPRAIPRCRQSITSEKIAGPLRTHNCRIYRPTLQAVPSGGTRVSHQRSSNSGKGRGIRCSSFSTSPYHENTSLSRALVPRERLSPIWPLRHNRRRACLSHNTPRHSERSTIDPVRTYTGQFNSHAPPPNKNARPRKRFTITHAHNRIRLLSCLPSNGISPPSSSKEKKACLPDPTPPPLLFVSVNQRSHTQLCNRQFFSRLLQTKRNRSRAVS